MQAQGEFKVKRTPTMEKAIFWYAEKNGLLVQLSTHPTYYFKDKEGNEHKENIFNILGQFEQARKEEKKEAKKWAK